MGDLLGKSLNAKKITKENKFKLALRSLHFSFQIDPPEKKLKNDTSEIINSVVLQSQDGESFKITKILKYEKAKDGRIDVTFSLDGTVNNDEPLSLIQHIGDVDESIIYFKDQTYTDLIALAKQQNEAKAEQTADA